MLDAALLSDIHLVKLNAALAAYNFLWFIVIVRIRWEQRDPFGGMWYALGYDIFLFGFTGSSLYRVVEGLPITTTPFTWVITLGLACGIVGQIATFRNDRENHGSTQ